MRTKNQHFVARAYLRFFSNDEKVIWIYDKKTEIMRPQSIKNTAVRKNFYGSKQHSDPLDNYPVPKLEGQARSIIKRIEQKEELDPKDLGILLNFLVLQFLRTPARKKDLESTFQVFWTELRKKYRNTESDQVNLLTKLEEIAESFIKEQKISGITAKDLLMNEDISVAYPQEDFSRSIALHGFRIAKTLANQNWEFLFTLKNEEFLTSDDPFSLFSSENTPYFPSVTSNVTKLIPLSRKVCLVIAGERFKIKVKEMLPWAVKVINLGIASRAERYVYCSNEKLLKEIINSLPQFKEDASPFVLN